MQLSLEWLFQAGSCNPQDSRALDYNPPPVFQCIQSYHLDAGCDAVELGVAIPGGVLRVGAPTPHVAGEQPDTVLLRQTSGVRSEKRHPGRSK